MNSAQCRHSGRFPTFAYLHKKTGNTLWKCSELKRESLNKAELVDDIFVPDAREREKQLHKKYKDARLPQTEYFNIGYPPSLDL